MATVNIHEAKTHLSRLLERVQRGERIIIARAGTPVAVLGPIEERRPKRVPGNDVIIVQPNFDDPIPEFDPEYEHPEDPMREPRA